VGYVCVMVYDIALCFPSELEYVWRTRWSVGKLLYILCRYCALFYLAVLLAYQFLVDCSLEVSKVLGNLECWGAIVAYAVFQVLVGVRTCALYHDSRFIKRTMIVLFLVYLLVAISMGLFFSKGSAYADPTLRGTPCTLQLQAYPLASFIALFFSSAAYDIVSWVILVTRVYQAYVQEQCRLIGIIFKLGLMYFTFVTIMNVVCAVLFMTLPQSKLLIVAAVAHSMQAVGSILSARFILRLRTYVDDLSIQSISMPPEQMMRVEDEMRFRRTTTRTDEAFDEHP